MKILITPPSSLLLSSSFLFRFWNIPARHDHEDSKISFKKEKNKKSLDLA
jgi:hypothetical protein